MTPEASIVERLYEALVEEVRRTRPELLAESFTVAEIYQNLVPYRTHRERVGAEMNGDYEHALLRLLAGEGDYVTLESDVARDRLEEELNSIHPDTGVYRNFAACEVRLRPERLEELGVSGELGGSEGDPAWTEEAEDPVEGAGAEEKAGGPEEAAGPGPGVELDLGPDDSTSDLPGETANGSDRPDDAGDTDGGPAEEETEDGESAQDGSDARDAGATVAGEGNGTGAARDAEIDSDSGGPYAGDDDSSDGVEEDAETCPWCRESLPDREDLRFCPFCGSSVDLRPCPECGAEVESEWIFCIACGTEVGD